MSSLRTYFYAYSHQKVDISYLPDTYFHIINLKTVNFIYNTLIIDRVFEEMEIEERVSILKQDILEIISYILQMDSKVEEERDKILAIIQLLVQDDFNIGSKYFESISNGLISLFAIGDSG